MSTIGFIGLGIMGKPMAKNLLAGGLSLVVYDVVSAAVDEVVAAGAAKGTSPKDVAEKSDIVVTMLPNSPHVREVVCGKNGILEGTKKGQIVVDMSSIAPLASRELGAMLAEKGAEMLDAPVSGGQEKAEKGTLAIMVGGSEASYEKVKDILALMGKSTLVGELGAGQTTKLVNQTIVAINIAAVAEGMAFAKKAGVDPRKIFEAIRGGLAGSQCMTDKAPRMFSGDYAPGGKMWLHVKDLKNVMTACHEYGVAMPLTESVLKMMEEVVRDAGPDTDHGGVAKYFEKLNGVSLATK